MAAAQARRAARLLLGCGTAGPGPRGRRARAPSKPSGVLGRSRELGQKLGREENSFSFPFFLIKSDLRIILQNKFQTIFLNSNKTWDHLELVFRLF